MLNCCMHFQKKRITYLLQKTFHTTMDALQSTGLVFWELKKVLDRKFGDNGFEYLVEWENVPGWPCTKTWEVYDTLQFSSEEALDLITDVNKFFYCMYLFFKTSYLCFLFSLTTSC
jgi:hypothetical protein